MRPFLNVYSVRSYRYAHSEILPLVKTNTLFTMHSPLQVNKNMAGIVKSLEKALASNNLETIANTMTQVRPCAPCAI